MNSTSNYISLMFTSIGTIMIACIVLVNLPEIGNNLTLGKRCWFHLSLLFLGTSIFFTSLFYPEKISFHFSITDALALCLLLISGFIHKWDITQEPDKFALALQLVILWFMLRIGLTMYAELSVFIITIILCIGSVEAVIGIIQFFSLTPEDHFLSQLTGSFINTTGYSGYLAILLPISLCWVLRYGTCRKSDWWSIRTLLFYIALPTLLLIMIILPAIINFTTWLAIIIPCIWISIRCLKWGHLLNKMKLRHSVVFTYAAIFLFVAIFITISSNYISKTSHGNTQLFQYHPTFNLHPKDPLAQVDLSGFKNVTASPHLPYRDAEINIVLISFLILFQAACFYQAYKRKLIDICGAILTATIFMIFSFSLVRPPFLITLILIDAVSTFRSSTNQPIKMHLGNKLYTVRPPHWVYVPSSIYLKRKGIALFSLLLLLVTYSLFHAQKDTYLSYQKWIEQKSAVQYEWGIDMNSIKYDYKYK